MSGGFSEESPFRSVQSCLEYYIPRQAVFLSQTGLRSMAPKRYVKSPAIILPAGTTNETTMLTEIQFGFIVFSYVICIPVFTVKG